jgi:dUTP pyrophosphatase
MLPTGISMSIPKGYYGRVAPRSGLALKNGLDVLAGVIDNDFISEVQVILYNTSDTPVNIEPYTRIAQLIIEKCDSFQLFVVDELESTERGENGFGSTGLM